MEALTLLLILFVLLFLRIPIYICLYLTGVAGLWIFTDLDFSFVAQTMLQKLDNFSLLSIPFFILLGAVMVKGQSAGRLVNLAWKLVSWVPGGLGITAVISSGVFGAISGSGISTVVTIGGVMFPHLNKHHYPQAFSVGLVTSAAILGIIIPPSIIMIICALTAGESVVRLFAAGYLPGGLIMLLLSLYAWWEARRKGLGRESLAPFNLGSLGLAAGQAFFPLLIITVLFGGIYSGAFTITEASVVSTAMVLLVEMLIYRAVSLRDLKELLISAGIVSGALVITVSGAGVISEYIILREIPQTILEISMAYIPNQAVFMLFTCVVLLILGTFMDQIGAIMILVPIMLPIALQMGVDPIHFCLVLTVGLGIGYITPPLGLLLYTAQAITRLEFVAVSKAIMGPLVIYIVGLLILCYVPWLSTAVPNLLLGPR
ncbi:MAG: TRAP transporter large permease [Deltaproteobacteria bacterium]|nr:TRAP transporter large permease [Deltaproteobacteria bacterium]